MPTSWDRVILSHALSRKNITICQKHCLQTYNIIRMGLLMVIVYLKDNSKKLSVLFKD